MNGDIVFWPDLEGAMALEAATWHDWLGVRDACPVAREARYGEDQIRYHYAKDPTALPAIAGGGMEEP